MRHFICNANPARVIFASGAISRLPEEVGRLGLERVLVLTTKEQQQLGEEVAGLLGPACAGVFPGAVMHTPVHSAGCGQPHRQAQRQVDIAIVRSRRFMPRTAIRSST